MGFLDSLSSAINQMAGVSENKTSVLETTLPPNFVPQIDRSAQRSYISDGTIGRSIRPRQTEIVMQQPDVTVLVKKKMFSSLAENFRPEFMDVKEKLFFKASKKLFSNKCTLISAYEQLFKIDQIIRDNGALSEYTLPLVLDATDVLKSSGQSPFSAGTDASLAVLRKLQYLSSPNYRTTWLSDREVTSANLGDGTGVMEFTNVSNVSCGHSIRFAEGSCSITMEDPYRLMLVTNDDIDRAINDSAGFTQNIFFQTTQIQLKDLTEQLKNKLNLIRAKRQASPIRFYVNEGAILFNKVRAIIDEEGREILFNYDGGFAGMGSSAQIDPGAFEGKNGLSEADYEVEIFKEVLKNIYLMLGSEKTARTNTIVFNAETNYVRRKMRLFFGGKNIIQPMDIVHVFFSSKTAIDTRITSKIVDAFSPNGMNSLFGSISSTLDNLSSLFGGKNTFDETEKNSIAGPEFPMWLWKMLKNDFTKQSAGTHVFTGLIQSPRSSYSQDGKYTISFSAVDNCHYFKQGRLNINPSVEVWNSALYDPLTPFDLETDSTTGFPTGGDSMPTLLPENLTLLQSGLLRFKNGRFMGTAASQQIYNSFEVETTPGGSNRLSIRRKFEDPDGLVYRWKQGIQTKTLLTEPHKTTQLPSEYSPNLRKDPFAGQDVMNVLSLLVTGVPYNFNTFMKSALSTGSFTSSSLKNESGAKSFFKGLIGDISKQNAIWGNFIPFKRLIVNDVTYSSILGGQYEATISNKKINSLLQERATKFDLLSKAIPELINNPQMLNVSVGGDIRNFNDSTNAINDIISKNPNLGGTIPSLAAEILSLDFEIQAQVSFFQKSINDPNIRNGATIQIFGDDISFNPSTTATVGGVSASDTERQRKELRNKLNILTQRRLWKVKANDDHNLFIVDDSYDKNYDIQAFSQALSDHLELFKSNYTDVGEQIQRVASILGLEVFADSQGHVHARAPQYNKMPSSVFYEMMAKKRLTGVQIFPTYLENLFISQVQGLIQKLEIDEDQIRLRCAALGYITDSQAKGILGGFQAGTFAFVTDESNGNFGGKDSRVLINQINPDLSNFEMDSKLKSLGSTLQSLTNSLNAIKSDVNFDIVQRVNTVNNTKLLGGINDTAISARMNELSARLLFKTGQAPAGRATLLSNSVDIKGISQADAVNVSSQLAQLISDRQSIITTLSNILKNLGDGVKLNASGPTDMIPFSSTNNNLPDLIEHMIEYEDIDDLGFGSGKRFVIRDSQIKSLTLKEESPEYTAVEVDGLYAQGLGDPPGGFDTGGGNPASTAWAVDFDLWRLYGLKQAQPVQAPFLSNPDSQCAPFAVSLLNKARKEILQAEVELVGNEYIQAGEVYYLEDLQMLFYAEKVEHSFSYGGNFSTTVSFKYGHNPGEYIPNILDIIGKSMYSKRNQADLIRHNRHGVSTGDIPLNVIVFDNTGTELNLDEALLQGTYGKENKKNLANMIMAVTGAYSISSVSTPTIELRVYGKDANLQRLAGAIQLWLKSPKESNNGNLYPDNNAVIGGNISNFVKLVPINLDDPSVIISPSQSAWNKALELSSSSSISSGLGSSSTDINLVKQALYTKVVDVWITFSPTPTTNQITGTPTPDQGQANYKVFQSTLDSFLSKIKTSSTDG